MGLASVRGFNAQHFREADLKTKVIAIALQTVWLSSELIGQSPLFKVSETFITNKASKNFFSSYIFGKLAVPILMMGLSLLSNCYNSLKRKYSQGKTQHQAPVKVESCCLENINEAITSEMNRSSSSTPLSDIETSSSRNSISLFDCPSSPTGHLDCLRYEKAIPIQSVREFSCRDDSISLVEYNVDGQMMLFVHKDLTQIKTKVEKKMMEESYRPLLRTLIQQSKSKHGMIGNEQKNVVPLRVKTCSELARQRTAENCVGLAKEA